MSTFRREINLETEPGGPTPINDGPVIDIMQNSERKYTKVHTQNHMDSNPLDLDVFK